LIFVDHPRASFALQDRAYLRGSFDKNSINNQNLAIPGWSRPELCTQKEWPALEGTNPFSGGMGQDRAEPDDPDGLIY
jgi:hypothetical protein